MASEHEKLVRDMAAATERVKGMDLFYQTGRPFFAPGCGELRVMRQWNSHTPSVENVDGGGYFLWWNEKGTVVDPGYSFVRLFRKARYRLSDIDMIAVTHDHSDHCHSLVPMISLFRQYTKRLKDRKISPKKRWELVASHGVVHQMSTILQNLSSPLNDSDERDLVFWETLAPPRNVGRLRTSVKTRSTARPTATPENDDIAERYRYRLGALDTYHSEYFHESENTAMGFRFDLLDPIGAFDARKASVKSIVLAGDTGINPDMNSRKCAWLARQYRGAHLLSLHVGSMEGMKQKRLKEHLGFNGVVGVLNFLKNDPCLECVVLTEWGYEFSPLYCKKRPLPGAAGDFSARTRFAYCLVEELRAKGCRKYYVPIQGVPRDGGTVPVIPADKDLRFRLPDLSVGSRVPNRWIPLADLQIREPSDDVEYL